VFRKQKRCASVKRLLSSLTFLDASTILNSVPFVPSRLPPTHTHTMNKTLKLLLSLLACAIALESGSLNVAELSAEVAQPEEVRVRDLCASKGLSSPSSPTA
jgi:hypothetical protein